jgi:hypothetical protein
MNLLSVIDLQTRLNISDLDPQFNATFAPEQAHVVFAHRNTDLVLIITMD